MGGGVGLTKHPMNDFNKVILTGRLTADPVFKTIDQTDLSEFTLAVNRKYKTETDAVKQSTEFVAIEAWGRNAQSVRAYLKKGRQVLLEGELHINKWEADGVNHSRPVVKASNIQFLSEGKPDAQAQPAARTEKTRKGKEPMNCRSEGLAFVGGYVHRNLKAKIKRVARSEKRTVTDVITGFLQDGVTSRKK